MKKVKGLFVLSILGVFALTGCTFTQINNNGKDIDNISGDEVSGSTTEVDIDDDTVTAEFTLKDSSDNTLSATNGVYTITSGGSYTATGKLEGQIAVNAASQNVELELNGVSLTNSSVSPIYVSTCSSFELKVKKDTTNYIYDTRTTDYSTTTTSDGTAAVYVDDGNLKVTGKGTLSVVSYANSGIHGKDNVVVKNVTMLIKAVNNGIKGNDKVTIEENPTLGIVAGNNGIITSNSVLGSSVQHGYIYINGGSLTINSYGDAIDAAYAIEMGTSTDTDGTTYTPTLDIYTNIYSSYTLTTVTSGVNVRKGPGGSRDNGGGGFGGGGWSGGSSAEKADDSAKAFKAVESITINAGNIFTYTYDDGLHTNEDTLDTGSTGKATININGGTLKMKASDDAIHSDGILNINGGTIYVSESHEAIEAKTINVAGGNTTVFGNDDGVNASNAINVSGGRLDVTVSPNGDTDGIDSNGTITISGGTIVTRGPNQDTACPLDSDGAQKMTGGTLLVLGYAPKNLTTSGVTKTTLSGGLTTGDHTVTIGSSTITYNNAYSYSGSLTVYGSGTASVK